MIMCNVLTCRLAGVVTASLGPITVAVTVEPSNNTVSIKLSASSASAPTTAAGPVGPVVAVNVALQPLRLGKVHIREYRKGWQLNGTVDAGTGTATAAPTIAATPTGSSSERGQGGAGSGVEFLRTG